MRVIDERGLVSIKWKGVDNGHCFSWKILNGDVTFFDYRHGRDDKAIDAAEYFQNIDPRGFLELVRLDQAKPNFEGLRRWTLTRK